MKAQIVVVMMVAWTFVACGGQSSRPRIDKVEVIYQTETSLTLTEYLYSHRGEFLDFIEVFNDGEFGWRSEYFYSGDKVSDIEYFDVDAKMMGTVAYEYRSGLLDRMTEDDLLGNLEVVDLSYDDSRLSEVVGRDGETIDYRTSFSYGDGLLERMTYFEDAQTDLTELEYDDLSLLRRVSQNGGDSSTSFSYDEEEGNRLDRVSSSGGTTYLEYNGSGLLDRAVTNYQGGITLSVRISYGDGETKGIYPSPPVSMGWLFNIKGHQLPIVLTNTYQVDSTP